MDRPATTLPAADRPRRGPGGSLAERLGAERAAALTAALRVFAGSRLLVFAVAVYAFLTTQPNRATASLVYDQPSLTRPFTGFWDVVLSPWARWDSIWYLGIASGGYDSAGLQAAFFPLYPLAARALGFVFGGFGIGPRGLFVAGLVISLAAFAGALYVLHRLVELELGRRFAAPALGLLAFFPMAFFFSAIYSESLFLLVSLLAFYAARSGRWAWAGLFGALAAATRSAGVVLMVPLCVMYLWGPRADRESPPRRPAAGWRERLRPLHPLRADALWLLLVPAGLVAYAVYLGAALGDAFQFVHAQDFWDRTFVPLGGVWEGAQAAWNGLGDILSDSAHPRLPGAGGGLAGGLDPLRYPAMNVVLFAFMVVGVVACIGTLRRLPAAYGAYAAAALAIPLSFPADVLPLVSLPRFLAVLFPLFAWGALVSEERGWTRWTLAASAVLLGLFTAQWATWQWVS